MRNFENFLRNFWFFLIFRKISKILFEPSNRRRINPSVERASLPARRRTRLPFKVRWVDSFFSITRVLAWIPMEHIDIKNSYESQLWFESICSIRIQSLSRVMAKTVSTLSIKSENATVDRVIFWSKSVRRRRASDSWHWIKRAHSKHSASKMSGKNELIMSLG